MRKKIILTAVIALLIACAAALFFAFRPAVRFDGDRIVSTDPARFFLRFSVLNAEDSETMSLREGDSLSVSWQIEGGSVDLVISMPGEPPVYRADGRGKGDAASFLLTVPQTGDYTISVTGRGAKGWMEFVSLPRE